MKSETYHIDAKNKVLGRLACQIALLLRGKQKTDFAPNKENKDIVLVKNASKMKITGRKMRNKKYYRHSGFLGGIKETSLKTLFEKDPGEVLKKAVFGMLPKNRLRSRVIKRLKIENHK